jgi:hypothetical protein
MKIDVEGLELDVIEGAEETLRRVQGFVVALEANRNVVERSGIETSDILRKLYSIRPCTFQVAEETGQVDFDRPFFDQFRTRAVYNVVGRSL